MSDRKTGDPVSKFIVQIAALSCAATHVPEITAAIQSLLKFGFRRAVQVELFVITHLHRDSVAPVSPGRHLLHGDERDLAFQELAFSAKIPGGVSYGDLNLDPLWEPLRNDPRFDHLLAQLAPHVMSGNKHLFRRGMLS
jgi:hypothetical protein